MENEITTKAGITMGQDPHQDPMKRIYIVVAVVFVALASLIVWRVCQQREPVYEGKPLTYYGVIYIDYTSSAW
jgi:hypothetical protein